MNPRATVAATSVRQVGVVLRAGLRLFTQSNIFSHVQEGLQDALAARGFSTVLLGSEDSINPEDVPPMPGIVMLGQVKPAFVKSLARRTPRLIAINGTYPGICNSVGPNENQSVDLLVEHLANLGHRSFGWIGGLPHYGRHEARQLAFEEALHARDLPRPSAVHTVIVPTGADRQEGREAMTQLLASGPASSRPTAVVAFNGMMARGAINYALQNGVRIPSEISIVAIDATRVCVEEEPHITCASTVPEKLGEAAARLILDGESGPEGAYHDLVLGAQLFPGTTTGKAGR
jgi:LacI family transcriptional regulator